MSSYSKEQLYSEKIFQWETIKGDYSSKSILLGNGFSINFSDSLRYKYLFEFFIKDCTENSRELFQVFETKNFEQILSNVEIANTVCRILKVSNESFALLCKEVRQGLIDAIYKIHPRPIDVSQDQVRWISIQFKDFDQIFTTNYDLFLYYIILEAKRINDHFFNRWDATYQFFKEPDIFSDRHVYFLHGALFLFEDAPTATTLKMKKPSEGYLLDQITDVIEKDQYPLFISEGNSLGKLKAIHSNTYLSYCLQQFERNTEKSLIIFGQSLSEQDNHIVNAIDKNYERIAISINVEDWSTMGELKAERNRISSLFKRADFQFYDSKSLFDFEPKFLIPEVPNAIS